MSDRITNDEDSACFGFDVLAVLAAHELAWIALENGPRLLAFEIKDAAVAAAK